REGPMKRGQASAAFVLLGALALVSCSRAGKFETVKVIKSALDFKVHATGQLQSAAPLFIDCPSVERMYEFTISFMAPEGKAVNKGDMVVAFDPRELLQRLQAKQSELDTATKELQRMRLQEDQTKETLALKLEEEKVNRQKAVRKADYPEGLIAAMELQKRKMELDLADLQQTLAERRLANQISGMASRVQVQEAKVRLLSDQVAKLELDVRRMNVLAPKAGVVVYTTNWDGGKKAVGDSVWLGDSVLELPDLGRMQIKAVILEVQAGRVEVGQSADVRLDANPDRAYKGRVSSLGTVFRVKSDSQPAVVFDAVIDLAESDPDLMRPGMAAGVDITVSSKKDVLQIPDAAVVYSEQGAAVWKKGPVSNDLTPVTLGARSAGMVEVLSGIAEGDSIVVRPGARGGRR
ncbi:MAG TPA: HlyD family efflux transporter periplasmic adaptor subunit, partial [Acidobacteriota bacterium]|nr:HlyD family efflux transporter periplasmic adaptor subunit [Acidobacteriota bacterium]